MVWKKSGIPVANISARSACMTPSSPWPAVSSFSILPSSRQIRCVFRLKCIHVQASFRWLLLNRFLIIIGRLKSSEAITLQYSTVWPYVCKRQPSFFLYILYTEKHLQRFRRNNNSPFTFLQLFNLNWYEGGLLST